MINFDYVRPTTQKAAIDALNKDATSQLIAGGTNLVDLMKRGVTTPQKLIDITNLPLKKIEKVGSVIRIGALALNSEVAEHELILKTAPSFTSFKLLIYQIPPRTISGLLIICLMFQTIHAPIFSNQNRSSCPACILLSNL